MVVTTAFSTLGRDGGEEMDVLCCTPDSSLGVRGARTIMGRSYLTATAARVVSLHDALLGLGPVQGTVQGVAAGVWAHTPLLCSPYTTVHKEHSLNFCLWRFFFWIKENNERKKTKIEKSHEITERSSLLNIPCHPAGRKKPSSKWMHSAKETECKLCKS